MQHSPISTRRALLAGALVIGTIGCGSDDPAPAADSVAMSDTWSREPVAGQTTSAFYGIISNDGDTAVTAVAASSGVTADVELHEVVMNDDGTMTMQERDGGYEIPAGGSITLEPGGLHVMLLGIDPETYPDMVDVTIEFDDGSTLDVSGEVRTVDGEMHMDHDDMDHDMSEMDHDDTDMDHDDTDDG